MIDLDFFLLLVAGTIGPIEDLWTHGTPKGAGFTCNYCTYVSKGGGKLGYDYIWLNYKENAHLAVEFHLLSVR